MKSEFARVAFRDSACLPFTLDVLHPKLQEQTARLHADDAGAGAKPVVEYNGSGST